MVIDHIVSLKSIIQKGRVYYKCIVEQEAASGHVVYCVVVYGHINISILQYMVVYCNLCIVSAAQILRISVSAYYTLYQYSILYCIVGVSGRISIS